MDKQDAILLFHSMHPDFFEKDCIQCLCEDWIFEEMLLRLEEFDEHKYEIAFDASISFGFFGVRVSL